MKISIISNIFLEISIDGVIVFHYDSPRDNLSYYLNKYLPPLNKVKEIYLLMGPGSLMAARNLLSYFLGWTNFLHNKSIKVYLIDIVRDWYLKKWPHKKIIVPFTNKKLLVGYLENQEYKYYFIDNIDEIKDDYWVDYTIEKFDFNYNKSKIIYWNSLNLLECFSENNTLNNIIQYKTW